MLTLLVSRQPESDIATQLIVVLAAAAASAVAVPFFLGILRGLGLYDIVQEKRCHVYVLFGKVKGVISEPGIYFLPSIIGPSAFIVNIFGQRHVLDMRLDQQYLRSQPVNSEEGAPMGIGIWYEMFISDPVAYLFRNMDPRGSLAANVSNSTVRCLSNMPLAQMLMTRHMMSLTVRQEVSPKSHEWGYKLGSVYIRKVHFRDAGMIRQIESKVVNRLRQVTASINQDGTNQVNVITSSADRVAAVEFAKAAAIRPHLVGVSLSKISQDPELTNALFDVLEVQRLLGGKAEITLLPSGGKLLGELLASRGGGSADAAPRPPMPPPMAAR